MIKLNLANTTWQQNILLNAAALYCAKNLPGFAKRKVRIQIKLVRNLQSNPKWLCRGVAFQDNSNHYTIFIARELSATMLVKVLAHELTHVSQWITGKMQDVDPMRAKVRWGKRMYYPNKLAYKRHPWERDAERNMQRLARGFMKLWRNRAYQG